jgi:3-hydroxybutyrate dehydrogenase
MVSITDAADLRSRTALVTGSTGGIGLAIAARLAEAGCDVVLHGPGPAPAPELPGARYVQAELTRLTEIEAMVAEIGAIDILVNNAATRHFGPIEATPPAAWDTDLAVNLSAAFHLIRLTLPGMRARGWGRIVNISSIYGLTGTVDRVGYVTTKTALIGLTRAVALETAESGITCNALCPGTTLTPAIESRIRAAMGKGLGREEAEALQLVGKQPTGRFVEAAAVGAMVAFLCSEAGRDITGAALPMDGGWSAA